MTALASVTRAKLVFVETGCALDGGVEAKLITGMGGRVNDGGLITGLSSCHEVERIVVDGE